MKHLKSRLCLICILILLLPTFCFADGGGPILLLVNGLFFSIGQIWILFFEFMFLKKLFDDYSHLNTNPYNKRKVFKITFIMNLYSTILGAILLPFILAAVTYLAYIKMDNDIGDILFAVGTWIAGDHTPHPGIAIVATVIGFIITYFLTVFLQT